MSENRNKKHLHNRLDSIFSDLDDSTHLPGMSIFNQQSGWIWEIDDQGLFTNCSPDVEALLGYEASTILGQSISNISNFELEEAGLPTDPATASPKIVQVTFFRVDGAKEETSCHFLPLHQGGKLQGWRGMTVIESRGNHPLAQPMEDEEILEQGLSLPRPDPEPSSPIAAADVPKPSPNGNGEIREIIGEEDLAEEDISYEELYVASAYQPSDELRQFFFG